MSNFASEQQCDSHDSTTITSGAGASCFFQLGESRYSFSHRGAEGFKVEREYIDVIFLIADIDALMMLDASKGLQMSTEYIRKLDSMARDVCNSSNNCTVVSIYDVPLQEEAHFTNYTIHFNESGNKLYFKAMLVNLRFCIFLKWYPVTTKSVAPKTFLFFVSLLSINFAFVASKYARSEQKCLNDFILYNQHCIFDT